MARIGVMGGTFDPIHFGHLILAEEALGALELDRVMFVTSANPPHKDARTVTAAEDRHKMVEAAVVGNVRFTPSRIELQRAGASYTVDTLQSLGSDAMRRKALCPDAEAPGNHGDELFLLLGADEAQAFMTWHDPMGILDLATVIVANRPGYDAEESVLVIPRTRRAQARTLRIPGVDISSTDIRERVAQSKSIRYLVPDTVRDYIIEKGLYKSL